MLNWLKKYKSLITACLISFFVLLYVYGCEPKVESINGNRRMVTREELQVELNQIMALAEVRMLELEKQEQLRALILENALIIVEGQPFNPVGLITGFAALYGVSQGSFQIGRGVKNKVKKRKNNGGAS